MPAANPEFLRLRAGVQQLLQDLGLLLSELVERPQQQGRPGSALEADQTDEEAHLILDQQLNSFFRAFRGLRARHDDNSLSLAVLALTKSGKSTLINALVGHDLMPVNNVPETARICKVVHTPRPGASPSSAPEPLLVEPDGRRVAGEAAVKARLQQLNSAARQPTSAYTPPPPSSAYAQSPGSPSASPSTAVAGGSGATPMAGGAGLSTSPQREGPTLCGLASAGRAGSGGSNGAGLICDLESVLQIHVPVAALQQYDTDTSARLCLLDTPGPNEAGEENLRFQVERLLGSVDAVLYLLDYTKLKTCEEAAMFQRLQQVNPQLVRRLAQRLFFVVNKVDTMSTSEGQGAEETREYVADLVSRQLNLEGFRLQPEQVILISARNALLSRLVLAGRASDENLSRFLNLAFGTFGAAMVKRASSSAAGGAAAAAAAIGHDSVSAAASVVLEDSGILDLEHKVLAFLYAHGGSVKLLATMDDIGRLLQQVRNVAALCQACLQQGVETLAMRSDSLRYDLQDTLSAFDSLTVQLGGGMSASAASAASAGAAAAATAAGGACGNLGQEGARRERDEAAVWAGEMRDMLGALRTRLYQQILTALEDADAAGVGSASTPSPSGAAAAPSTGVRSRWDRVRARFLSMFGVDSVGGGGRARGRSKTQDEIASELMDLHEDLTRQIHAEVSEFWSVLEAAAAQRHRQLLRRVNGALHVVTARVEALVSERLQVTLEPVSIQLVAPSALQFHSDLQDLIAKGITARQEKHVRVAQRHQPGARVLRHHDGICRWGSYWEVQPPRMRTVVETYMATVYELKPEQIRAHFLELVENAVGNTEAALEAYVRSFVEGQLQAARGKVQDYCDRYMCAATAALDAARAGTDARRFALDQVESHLGRVNAISAQLEGLQQAAAGLVPCLQEPEAYDELEDEELQGLGGQQAQAAGQHEGAGQEKRQGQQAEKEVVEEEEEERGQERVPLLARGVGEEAWGLSGPAAVPVAAAAAVVRQAGREEEEEEEGAGVAAQAAAAVGGVGLGSQGALPWAVFAADEDGEGQGVEAEGKEGQQEAGQGQGAAAGALEMDLLGDVIEEDVREKAAAPAVEVQEWRAQLVQEEEEEEEEEEESEEEEEEESEEEEEEEEEEESEEEEEEEESEEEEEEEESDEEEEEEEEEEERFLSPGDMSSDDGLVVLGPEDMEGHEEAGAGFVPQAVQAAGVQLAEVGGREGVQGAKEEEEEEVGGEGRVHEGQEVESDQLVPDIDQVDQGVGEAVLAQQYHQQQEQEQYEQQQQELQQVAAEGLAAKEERQVQSHDVGVQEDGAEPAAAEAAAAEAAAAGAAATPQRAGQEGLRKEEEEGSEEEEDEVEGSKVLSSSVGAEPGAEAATDAAGQGQAQGQSQSQLQGQGSVLVLQPAGFMVPPAAAPSPPAELEYVMHDEAPFDYAQGFARAMSGSLAMTASTMQASGMYSSAMQGSAMQGSAMQGSAMRGSVMQAGAAAAPGLVSHAPESMSDDDWTEVTAECD